MEEKDKSKESSQLQPFNFRRSAAPDLDGRAVNYAEAGLSREKLEALRGFIEQASSDEIAQIRNLYGHHPEVLKWIGLEIDPD